MKKVISALTAAAMCASMSVSVMPAFAVYTANDVEFYLKIASASAGTVSADGTTITFASAAEAKSAKLVVQEYIKADASNPSVQQVGSTFSVSDKAISLGNGLDFSESIGDEKEYTLNGVTVKTDTFVNCFSYAYKKKFKNGTGDVAWGHSSKYTWAYDGVDQLSIIWASDFGNKNYDDYEQTAHFAGDASDSYPFCEFDATIGDVADGVYSIDIIDSWEHAENGTQHGTFVNVDGKNKVLITNHPGITINVGAVEDTKPSTEDTKSSTEDTKPSTESTAPSTEDTKPSTESTAPSTNPTDPTEPSQASKDFDKWTWYMDDVVYDPAADADEMGAKVTVSVTKDPGTYGFEFTPLIDGKSLKDAGFEIVDAAQIKSAYNFGTFKFNDKNGHVGAASKTEGDTTVKDGDAVMELYLLPPKDAKPGTKYVVSFDNLIVGNFAGEKNTPAVANGSITIGESAEPTKESTEPSTEPSKESTEPTKESTEPTKESAEPSSESTEPGKVSYLYGDVNENGKVELVDVVKLNRFLTGIDKDLSAVATVNANCQRAGESDAATTKDNLNAKDSIAILRYLIGLVTELPAQD